MNSIVSRTETRSRVINNPADPYGPPIVKFEVCVFDSVAKRWWYVRKVHCRRGPEDDIRYEFTSDHTYAKLMCYSTARYHQSNLGPNCLNESV